MRIYILYLAGITCDGFLVVGAVVPIAVPPSAARQVRQGHNDWKTEYQAYPRDINIYWKFSQVSKITELKVRKLTPIL